MRDQQNIRLCQYRYDPLDRVSGHVQHDRPALERFYCKNRLATEIQGTLHTSILKHDILLLAQQQREDSLLTTELLATDQPGSVLHILGAGTPSKSISYSPYGHRNSENGLLSLLGFNSERRDAITGHYLLGNGYRAFNPTLMRFNSPDSESPFDKGGVNAYSYCAGDPINFHDPTGNRSLSFLWKIMRPYTYLKVAVGEFRNAITYNKLLNLKPKIEQSIKNDHFFEPRKEPASLKTLASERMGEFPTLTNEISDTLKHLKLKPLKRIRSDEQKNELLSYLDGKLPNDRSSVGAGFIDDATLNKLSERGYSDKFVSLVNKYKKTKIANVMTEIRQAQYEKGRRKDWRRAS